MHPSTFRSKHVGKSALKFRFIRNSCSVLVMSLIHIRIGPHAIEVEDSNVETSTT